MEMGEGEEPKSNNGDANKKIFLKAKFCTSLNK
jgi:hypothetical protein